MAIRGRKPKTTEQKRRAGNPGRRPLNENEPQPTEGAPPMPAHLSVAGQAAWQWLIGELKVMGLLAGCDVALLTVYCDTWSEYIAVREVLAQQGAATFVLRGDKGGYYVNPLLNVEASFKKQLLQCAGELGLGPVARARLSVTPKQQAPEGKGRFFKVVG